MQFSLSLLQYIHIGSTGFRVIQRDFRRSRNTRLKVHHNARTHVEVVSPLSDPESPDERNEKSGWRGL